MTIMTKPVNDDYCEGWERTYRHEPVRDTTLDIPVRPWPFIGTTPEWRNDLPSHYRDDDEEILTPSVFHA